MASGTKAPDFTLSDRSGQPRKPFEYPEQCVILYFHPQGTMTGRTKQACIFAELYPQFREGGTMALGINKDSVASHKKFEEKYGLPFVPLSDPERTVIQAYDVWKEKKMYGKVSMDVVQTTYLIDGQGIIMKGFEKVKPTENPADAPGEFA